MDNLPKYKLIDTLVESHDTCPIQILEGKFAGIIFKFGKISLREDGSDNLTVTMDITMIEAPEGFDQQNPEFTNTVGEIFVNIVENDSTIKDPVDLEDDVHQDND